MGSNHSKLLHAIDVAIYDDSDIREYLVDSHVLFYHLAVQLFLKSM